MSLPPYEPDGSLPEVISDDLSPKELVERYGVSKQTLYTRLAALGITPHLSLIHISEPTRPS